MTIEDDRKLFTHNSHTINEYVDNMVKVLQIDGEAYKVAYMAIDMIYRPFLQWMHSAQCLGEDPNIVRNSAVHLLNVMLLEMSVRLKSHDEGKTLGPKEWADEIIHDIHVELLTDLASVEARKRNTPH